MPTPIVPRSRTGQFLPGRSGNPAGRPRGIRSRTGMLVASIIGDNAAVVTRAIVQNALEGDRAAQKLCMDRMLGPAREAPLELDLDWEPTPAGIALALGEILAGVGRGDVTAAEAAFLAKVIAERHEAVLGLTDRDRACIGTVEGTLGEEEEEEESAAPAPALPAPDAGEPDKA